MTALLLIGDIKFYTTDAALFAFHQKHNETIGSGEAGFWASGPLLATRTDSNGEVTDQRENDTEGHQAMWISASTEVRMVFELPLADGFEAHPLTGFTDRAAE